MLVQRRDLIAGLSALTAAGVLPAAQAKSLTARDQSRSVAYVPAAHLPEDEHAIHRRHMSVAIDLAETVPFPFGAVIVDRAQQRIVAKGANAGAENPIFHGEIMAIINCAKANPDVKWEDLTIYSSGEPCPMCQCAIIWTGMAEAVYGTSVHTLSEMGVNQIKLDSPTVAAAAPFYSGRIVGGVLKERADAMYQKWADTL